MRKKLIMVTGSFIVIIVIFFLYGGPNTFEC
jgi:hypothetical protein